MLAPMAGVTDSAYRQIVRRFFNGLMFTEMVSAKALIYNNEKTRKMLLFDDSERPMAVQIFGCQPDFMARAARLVEQYVCPDVIDINMGCPAPKIVNNNEGSALMKDIALARRIIEEVVSSVECPVTVKMRKGFDDEYITAVELAAVAEEAGAQMVTVHGRTREQFYSGKADWDIIAQVAHAVSIPVIGNGDVFSPADAQRMLTETGCAGVMIARGAQGNPWLCARIERVLSGIEDPGPPDAAELFATIRQHLKLAVEFKGEHLAVREMRKHIAWYLKGLPYASEMRGRIFAAETEQEMLNLLEEYQEQLQQY